MITIKDLKQFYVFLHCFQRTVKEILTVISVFKHTLLYKNNTPEYTLWFMTSGLLYIPPL